MYNLSHWILLEAESTLLPVMIRYLQIQFLRFNVRWLIKGFSLSKEEAYTTVLLIGIRKEARSQVLHLSRNKRYTLTPEQLKWDKFKLTYKYSFCNLLVL